MPTRATMSIVGMYNTDNTIFDNFSVPAGNPSDPDNPIPAANKSVAIGKIILDCAELELIYSDIDFLKFAIANWSLVNKNKWDKLWYTENVSYDPIANVDALETETHNLTYDRNLTYGRDDKGNYQGFNSGTYRNVTQQDDKDSETGYTKDTGTITKDRHGNIGVTSTQQLLTAEREVADYSLYQVIADDFKKAFCVLVY